MSRHKKKLDNWKQQQKRELDIRFNENWFFKKTETIIPDDVKWLLSHGKKFALPSTKANLPLLQYIADGEEWIKALETKKGTGDREK